MKAVTVYCASSTSLEPEFARTAREVGDLLAERGIELIYGGGGIGLMGEVARAMHARGGRVVGVITRHLLDHEQGWDGCDELIVVESMRERKRILVERGDGFLVLPGGLGTYEEFFETLVGRQLREHAKPIGIVNDRGYFDPLVAMIEHGIEHRFIKPAVKELFTIDPHPRRVLEWLETAPAVEIDPQRFLPMGRIEEPPDPPLPPEHAPIRIAP
jgi:uncharacterized protein (TIGR00730 family)